MKITKKRLRWIIREMLEARAPKERFDELVTSSDLALQSYVKAMSRARGSDLESMAKLWSAMVAAPGDVAAAREIAGSLGLSAALASFHARKVKPDGDYPTGAELKEIVLAQREAAPARKRYSPPRKPYGGGSRQRPWDQST